MVDRIRAAKADDIASVQEPKAKISLLALMNESGTVAAKVKKQIAAQRMRSADVTICDHQTIVIRRALMHLIALKYIDEWDCDRANSRMIELAQRLLDCSRGTEDRVVIDRNYELTTSEARTSIALDNKSGRFLETKKADLRELPRNEGRGSVSRAIIDDQHLRLSSLLQRRLNRRTNLFLAVFRGDHNSRRDGGAMFHVCCLCSGHSSKKFHWAHSVAIPQICSKRRA